MNVFVFKSVASLDKWPCGIFKFSLFFFIMPDFWAWWEYKVAHVFCSNLVERYEKAFMGKSSFDKATRENNGNMPDRNPWF